MAPEAMLFVGVYVCMIIWAFSMVFRALGTPSSSGRGFMEGERAPGYGGKIPGK